jgi:probable selenium-dependent hydroxylase accessory protein YqeC
MSHRLRDALLLKDGGVVCLVGAGGKTSLMYRLAQELSGNGEKVLTTTTTRIRTPTPDQSPGCILGATADHILDRAGGMLKKHRHVTAAAGANAEAGKLTGLTAENIDRLLAARVFDWIVVEADGAAGRSLKAPAGHEPVIPATTGWLVGLVGLSAVGKPLSEEWVFRAGIFSSLSGLPQGAAVTAEAVAAVLVHERGILKGAPSRCRRLAFLNQADTVEREAAGLQIVGAIRRLGVGWLERAIVGQVLGEPPVSGVYDLNE